MALIKRFNVDILSNEDKIDVLLNKLKENEKIIEVKLENKQIIVKSLEDVQDEVNQIINNIDLNDNLIVKEFYFDGIDCPNCANKVETHLKKQKYFNDVNLSFINKKIVVKCNKELDALKILSEEISKIEKDATIFSNKPNFFGMKHEEHHHEHHHHEHDHSHCEKGCNVKKKKVNYRLILLIVGLMFGAFASTLQFLNYWFVMRTICFIIAYLLLAYDLLIKAFMGIKNKDFFNENTLMVIASIGALCIDEGFEGIMVVLLNRIGEYYQNKATERSKKAIQDMIELEESEVTLKGGKIIPIEDVKIGDIIVVKVGEKIPVDGKLLSNNAILDMKSLTGESYPVNKIENEEVLSGSINKERVIEIEATKIYDDSTVNKVKKLIESANDKKSKTQEFIAKFAKVYTPIIIFLAVAIGLIQGFVFEKPITNCLNSVFSILVIACPCALVISIPLCYFSGIGRSSKEGILVKGGNYLDAIVKANMFVFDKTGTLTKGNFVVSKIVSIDISKDELLEKASCCEIYSTHPIGVSIKNHYGKKIEISDDTVIEEITGEGVVLTKKDNILLAGNAKLMERYNIKVDNVNDVGSIVYLVEDGKYLGYIVVSDQIKEESKPLVTWLKKHKYQTCMLTGDNKQVALDVSNKLCLDNVYYKLLPEDKFNLLKEMIDNKNKAVYVGDGINDSPSLALSDVGISLGGIGADIAKESADVVIMNDDISKIKTFINIGSLTRKIMIQNIVMILMIKLIAIVIGALGILGSYAMFLSIFSDVGVCLLAILNTLRIMKKTIV